ncbi:MAG TPA: hypothetical protein VHA52_00320 [Candidatus Babeliaceae bacterium]|nr:hypothetical protein [Candidatus Babeliaceae bacterium]
MKNQKSRKVWLTICLCSTLFPLKAGLCECHLPKRYSAQEKNQIYPGIENRQACHEKCRERQGDFVTFYEPSIKS